MPAPARCVLVVLAVLTEATACAPGPTRALPSEQGVPVEMPPQPSPPPSASAPPASPVETVAAEPVESISLLPYRREPIVVVSTDPAHCPPTVLGLPSTAVGDGVQCIRYLGNLGHWYRVVLAPEEPPAKTSKRAKKTRYRLCVSEVGTRPPRYSGFATDDDLPRADFEVALSDLPGGKPLEIVNAPVWKKGGEDEIPLSCGKRPPLPVVKVGPGDALPRWVERETGKVVERGF